MNEINIFDEIREAIVRFGEAIVEAFEPLLDAIYKLEPYQRFELLHPQKKPRGSIRRKRKRRIVYAKDAYELGEVLYEGMMDGFEQGESEVKADETDN